MTLTVTHSFVSGVADDPTAAAAGEVLPSHWNAQHVVTGVALQVATGNITLFVSTLGSDSNPGTALLPFRTIQHAMNVCATFSYISQFFPTVNVSAGTYHENVVLPFLFGATEVTSTFGTTGNLTGDLVTWTNCQIAPNNGTGNPNLFWPYLSGWQVQGFSLVADSSAGVGGVFSMIEVFNHSLAEFGSIDFNIGSASAVVQFFFARTFSRTGAVGDFTFQGTGNTNGFAEAQGRVYCHLGDNNWIFNSSFTCTGSNLFEAFTSSFLGIGGITFVRPGNITGASNQFSLFSSHVDMEGIDPATITWPGLATFTPVGIDALSTIDGLPYTKLYSGAPVDESSIYRGSWQIHKDSNQTTAGIGLNLYVDDAGTVVPLIALTPAPGNLTFFVSTTGSDSNPGTSGSPFRTIQHAVSVALSFDYQSLYTCTVNVANGTYHEHVRVDGGLTFGSLIGSPVSGSIIGNAAAPANVVIQPNDNSGDHIINFTSNGSWALDGFALTADATENNGGAAFINTLQANRLQLGTLNLNTGTGRSYFAGLAAGSFSNVTGGFGAGSGNITISGDGAAISGGLFRAVNYSRIALVNIIVFSSAINMGANNVFDGEVNSFLSLNGVTFTTPVNVTNGIPLNLIFDSDLQLGFDPTTITWPGGAFSTSTLDASSTVDGLFYGLQIAGQLTDETNIYRGSWRIFKDTSATRRYLTYDDGGTIYAKQIGRVPNTQTGTPYVLALSDQDGRVEMSNAGANQLTVPANATVAFPIGTEIRVVQVGAGATTIAGAVGVTVDAAGVVGGQWKSVMLYKRGTNEWVQTNV